MTSQYMEAALHEEERDDDDDDDDDDAMAMLRHVRTNTLRPQANSSPLPHAFVIVTPLGIHASPPRVFIW